MAVFTIATCHGRCSFTLVKGPYHSNMLKVSESHEMPLPFPTKVEAVRCHRDKQPNFKLCQMHTGRFVNSYRMNIMLVQSDCDHGAMNFLNSGE